jgi:hypothetical protein
LQALATTLGVDSSVRFMGIQQGAELDAVFDNADVALDSLATHRLDLPCSSSLKAREYCARGVPFVTATQDPDFPECLDFIHRVSSTDQPLNISAVREFHEQILRSLPNATTEMRDYAESHLSWTTKLEPVFQYLRDKRPAAQ